MSEPELARADGGVRVLYIAGVGRSGSTLVSCLLGQSESVFAAGELRYLWRRGVIENRLCGCGLPFGDCPTWRTVIAAAGGVPPDVAATDATQQRVTRARSLPLFLWRSRRRQRMLRHELSPLRHVYCSLAQRDGVNVIVDSSKLPTYALALLDLPGLEVDVLHLVRDPRATAFSWQRWRRLPDVADGRWMQRQSPAKSACLWLLWNLVTETLVRRRLRGRYLRIRYEDLVDSPLGTVEDIRRLIGSPPGATSLSDDTVSLEPTHTVAGNPGRLTQGSLHLVPDVEWVRAMCRRDRWLVTLLTWPLLVRYGYRVRPEG
jgi:hypothetical protein